MSEDDRSNYYDAIEDTLPRGVSKATLNTLVTATYDERATEVRCWEILQAEEDAGTVSDALDAANRVMALFVMGDDGWDLRVKTAKMVTPPQQVVMLATAQVGPTAQRPTPKGPTIHPGGTAVKDVFQDGTTGNGARGKWYTGHRPRGQNSTFQTQVTAADR